MTETTKVRKTDFLTENKGYTNISNGIDLITSEARRRKQVELEELIRVDGCRVRMSRLRNILQDLKMREELAVLELDKKNNAAGEKVIEFYRQEQALKQQQYLRNDIFESNRSRQLKLVGLECRATIETLKERMKQAAESKKQKMEDGTSKASSVADLEFTEDDQQKLQIRNQQATTAHQDYLIELRAIKENLCAEGLKFESAESRQLFKSFQNDAGIERTDQRYQKEQRKKASESGDATALREMLDELCTAVTNNPNGGLVKSSDIDPEELRRVSRILHAAQKQVKEIDESDANAMELIDRIAERAVSLF